jgi:hypothetical protein
MFKEKGKHPSCEVKFPNVIFSKTPFKKIENRIQFIGKRRLLVRIILIWVIL